MRLKRKIYVTSTYLPPKEEFLRYVDAFYASRQLTNLGPLQTELEEKLGARLGVEEPLCVGNATLGLMLALRALDLTEGEIITTPFSYVATLSSILWERCTPVFADIRADSLTLDPALLQKALSPRTRAILPVHVFGYACAVDEIDAFAAGHGLKVIYDAAHALGAKLRGRSLLTYGDVSVSSMHATKLLHTAEGGLIWAGAAATRRRLELLRRCGHNYDEYYEPGINAKLSEPHAALGLACLRHLDEILAARKNLCAQYDRLLGNLVGRPAPPPDMEHNYAYYPVIFRDETQLKRVCKALNASGVYPRRYFFPSLNTLPYLPVRQPCPTSEDVATRIACLPLFPDLLAEEVDAICALIRENL
ncbi:MAG: DegT/DnrJ/EryC1/StrS family aminotransferase [Deltaproteobacteria bacterium]|jgi:dTDP-4-amino-4,6-dideoxygalactose transaminase|nr:DegT/DnrJ/EryC1/StrS family aminotransferase [Deltaproteobacteria bacterium]